MKLDYRYLDIKLLYKLLILIIFMDAVQEARQKLAEKFGDATRVGGKGVARRKVPLLCRKKLSPNPKSLMIIK